MITNWEEYKIIGEEFQNEFQDTLLKNVSHFPKRSVCVELDKPNYIYTDNNLGIVFTDYVDHYHTYFGQGYGFPEEKIGLAWVTDKDTIFFFERPFNNKVLNVLKTLLPTENVEFDGNDIIINGLKVGPSLRTGWESREGEPNYNGSTNTGHIYCLRWSNLDKLNELFKDIRHHQDRLENKAELTTLSEHLDISKEEFIKLLEE